MSSLPRLEAIPLEECLRVLGGDTKSDVSIMDRHLRLSIAEHLKDARRWQFVKYQGVIKDMSPDAFERWVDGQLELRK